MKQTVALKLETTPEQFDALIETMEAFNAGCNIVGALAFEKRSANKIALQPFVYGQLREMFGLSSQMAVRCIAKGCDAYKSARALHKERVHARTAENAKRLAKGEIPLPDIPALTAPTFQPHGAIVYDERIMNVRDAAHVSLLTLKGRVIIGMRYGAYQAARMQFQKGQADLVLRNGVLYLYICIDLPSAAPVETEGFLGVDLGIVEIAVDSQGNRYSGAAVKSIRTKVREHRRQLQRKQTNSAKKRLRRIAARQPRFVRDTNHCISKRIVATGLALKKALAIEDLSGIRDRSTVSKTMRWLLGNWAFNQIGQFIGYKAELAGLPLVFVDPRNTSRICSQCGYCDKANRKSQACFLCIECGFSANADDNASKNIEARAAQSYSLLSSATPLAT